MALFGTTLAHLWGSLVSYWTTLAFSGNTFAPEFHYKKTFSISKTLKKPNFSQFQAYYITETAIYLAIVFIHATICARVSGTHYS
ncbi:MAG: hypothetical protein ACYSUS_05340 [Planctomycetota bacterium]|jgi:hypothetical protein